MMALTTLHVPAIADSPNSTAWYINNMVWLQMKYSHRIKIQHILN
jgi:hypothetical protein